MNLERISEALQSYTGQEESMHRVVDVLQEELGANWTQTVFQDLQNIAPALKENLTHVFDYYAATMAWNEIQGYLAEPQLVRTPELEERLPVLKHWLDFFGAPGQAAYQSLEAKLSEPAVSVPEAGSIEAEEQTQDVIVNAGESEVSDTISVAEVPLETEDMQAALDPNEEQEDVSEVDENAEMENAEPAEIKTVHEKCFDIQRIENLLNLLKQNQAWLSARCIQLKNIEIYAYPFYGYIVDLLRQVLKGMEDILSDETKAAAIETDFEGGREAFDHQKEAIQHDITLAEQNCESATTALISEDMDMDEVKRTLGTIDESDTVEYVGPAPDGFELLDNETPLDETAIKQQYEKIEKMDALTGTKEESVSESGEAKENTSQNTQKGVQRKLSFNLKHKKATEGES